ncbi:MAG: hypothetical protein FJ290_24790, partial [Planctomycetes bacterium]|nr:hypothetical protein [Planctomycetota bacterium]
MARKDPAKAEAAPLGVSGRLMQMVTALFADVPPETRLYALVAVVIQLSFLAVILLLPRETRLTCFAVNAVLILAYALLLRHRLGSSAHRPQAGTDQAPPSSLPPLVGGGIVAYYASRNQALPALTEQILRAERELTLCGIALSSVSPILKDDRIVAFVSRKLLETKSFKVTIVILCQESGEAFDLRHREIPSRDLGKV